ncbi:MAG: TldD/PmbA family protein [Candidatus Hermodarchaeota archaeon]
MSLEKQKELIIELSEIALKRAQDSGCEAFISASIGKEYVTRFSNSEILQNYSDLCRDIAITVIYNDKQRINSNTNDLTKKGILNLIDYLTNTVKLVPPDPQYPGLVKQKQQFPSLTLNDPKVSNIKPETIVDKVEEAIVTGEAVDKRIEGVSGNILLTDGFKYYISTNGQDLFYPNTNITSTININALEQGEESRSNSTFGSRFLSKLGMEKEAKEVAERAIQGLGAKMIETGEYEVILDHQAVNRLLLYTNYATSARLVIDKFSFLTDKLGQQVFDKNFTLINNPHDPEHLGSRPIDEEGLATQPFPVVENGVLKNYSSSRLDAARLGIKPLGTCFNILGTTLGFPFATTMKPGAYSKEDMISEIKDGLLITNFHYINFVNPPVGSITGMTKDGLFIIKNGEIVGSAKNMRFTDEIPNILKEIEVGKELRQPIIQSYDIKNRVVPVRVKNFRFTSKT